MTGGGSDGSTAHGRNQNQGAESTLALLSTLQHARRLVADAQWTMSCAAPARGPASIPTRAG